ncbi:MAG TPA: hypothetical protein VGK13_08010 [Methanocellaceae archaeon]|jgi:hypothetical protein
MASEIRQIAFFFMGLVAICLVISFSAYQLTTYDSIRSIIGETAVQPSGMASLHSQYNDLQDFLTGSTGDVFTYHFAGSYIKVTRAQVQGKSEQQCNNLVLDSFTKSFYTGTDTGDLSFAYGFVGSGANAIYALLAFVFFIVLACILGAAFIRHWFDDNVELLKSSGTIMVAVCIVAFFVFLILPGILKSMMWSTLYGNTLHQEVLHVVEPRVSATFLVNTLIVTLVGAVFYGVGFFIGFEEKEHEESTERQFERKAAKPREQSLKVREQSLKVRDTPGKPGRRQL